MRTTSAPMILASVSIALIAGGVPLRLRIEALERGPQHPVLFRVH